MSELRAVCSAFLAVSIVAVACPAPAAAQQVAVYTNSFDDSSDIGSWYQYGYPYEWAVDSSPIEGHSPPNCLNINNGTDVDSPDYYFYGDIYTDSSTWNLPTGMTDPVLSFWCRWDLPTGIDYTDRYIWMYDYNDYDPFIQYYFGTDLNCGAADQWHQHQIPIDAGLLGGPFYFEIYIYYDWWNGGSGSGYEGWFIDDLQILVPDVTPPAAIADLAASNPTETAVDVSWTSPFDDDVSGVCDSFDLRYSTSQINDSNFDSATPVAGEPAPDAEGTTHLVTVTGLTPDTTYFFAIVTTDKAGNVSLVSGSATATTLTPPPPPAPASIPVSSFEVKNEDILPCAAGTSAAPAGLMALAGLFALAFGLRRKPPSH